MRLVQVIGEAARRVPDEIVRLHPAVPWKAIVGMRHELVHDDLGVDEAMVWDTVTKELSALVRSLEAIDE